MTMRRFVIVQRSSTRMEAGSENEYAKRGEGDANDQRRNDVADVDNHEGYPKVDL